MTQSAINAAKIISQKAPGFKPVFAMTLGSGLGELADLLTDVVKISYADLPDFPKCTVAGHAGNLFLINDYINFQFRNVLAGENQDDFGPRFLGMEDTFDITLREKLLSLSKKLSVPLQQGVYFAVLGPQFETPAEIKCFRTMGGDVIAMSAINEIVTAHHCGMRVAMISVISNMAAGMSSEKLSHELTLSGVKKGAESLKKLVLEFVGTF